MKMIRRFLVPLLTLLAMIIGSCTSQGSGITIEGAWARPAVEGTNTAIYLHITNIDADDAWIDVETKAAARSELHLSSMQPDGTVRMDPQEQIALPQNEVVELAPGGLHVMLIDLSQSLEPGDLVHLTLFFQQHPQMEIDVPVKAP